MLIYTFLSHFGKRARELRFGDYRKSTLTYDVLGGSTVYESTIRDLKVAIDRLQAEKQRIDEQVQALESSLRYFESQERGDAPPPPDATLPNSNQTRLEAVGQEPRQGADSSLRDAIADILSVDGTLHRRDIYERLVNRGVQIGGQNPISNVSAHLSIDSRFENVGRGLWQLAKQDEEATIFAADILNERSSDGEEDDDDVPW